MVNSTYQPPIDKLLTLGSQQPNDVAELGIGSEHIPDLIKMAVDNELLGANNDKEAWAPVHAWRILGQLQATDAIIPLIQLFKLEDNDLVNEELPKVYGKIGTAAIGALAEYLASQSHQLLARVTAINSLEEIANQHPKAHNQVVHVLTQSLQSCNQNEAELNGFIISTLINLQVEEAAPVIKYAFNTNQVAEDIVGNWDEVRQSLGISSDEEVQEYQPQALQQLTNTDTNIEIETPPSITEASTPDVEQASEDEINALINLVTEVTKTETQTQENVLPTPDNASEVTDTETSTQEDAVPTNESASEVTDTETQTEENALPITDNASELANIETQTEENALPTNDNASEVSETETSTQENTLPTTDNASENIETETLTEENALFTTTLASELANIETQTEENALPTTELTTEVAETETQTQENTLPTTNLASEVVETETQTEENTLPTTESVSENVEAETLTEDTALPTTTLASELANIETQTEENTLPTTASASETENTSLLPDEKEAQQEIIDTEENLTNAIDKVENEVEEVTSEIEAGKETQVTDEASTQVDESHEQTKDDKTEAVGVESSEELDSLEQEDNKGFGRPGTSKEKPEKPQKAKPSKKKKRGFSDL